MRRNPMICIVWMNYRKLALHKREVLILHLRNFLQKTIISEIEKGAKKKELLLIICLTYRILNFGDVLRFIQRRLADPSQLRIVTCWTKNFCFD